MEFEVCPSTKLHGALLEAAVGLVGFKTTCHLYRRLPVATGVLAHFQGRPEGRVWGVVRDYRDHYTEYNPSGPKDPNMEYVGFHVRNRNCGFGYIDSTWVLGPLGQSGSPNPLK